MPEWVRGLIIRDINEMHAKFRELIAVSEQLQRATTRRKGADPALAALARVRLERVQVLYANFNREVRATAERAAVQATRDIRDRLAKTQLRPDTESSPHLRDLIVCAPINLGSIPTGMVGIGDVDVLNRAVNRRSPGYGPYWRAQEYGTGFGEVPSQVGRILYGYFDVAGGGDATPPQAQYAGGGGGPHPIFQPARPRGGTGVSGMWGSIGLGTIGAEIQPKRFLELGSHGAAVAWRARLAVVQQQVIDGIAGLPL